MIRAIGSCFVFAALLACGNAGADTLPPSMAELPRVLCEEVTSNPRWFCFDVSDTENVRVQLNAGHDILVRVFDTRRGREISADVASPERSAHFTVGYGEYALSLWSAAAGDCEVQREVALRPTAKSIPEIESKVSVAVEKKLAGGSQSRELLRGAAGIVGGTNHAAEVSYRLRVADGYGAVLLVTTTGAPATIEVRNGRGSVIPIRQGKMELPTGYHDLRLRGIADRETRYEISVWMNRKKIELDRASARPLDIDRTQVVTVGGDKPRAAWLAFAISGRSMVRLSASRHGGPATMTVADAAGRHIATMPLHTTTAELPRLLERGHYYVRIESDEGAAANVSMRVFRFDKAAPFEKKSTRKR